MQLLRARRHAEYHIVTSLVRRGGVFPVIVIYLKISAVVKDKPLVRESSNWPVVFVNLRVCQKVVTDARIILASDGSVWINLSSKNSI